MSLGSLKVGSRSDSIQIATCLQERENIWNRMYCAHYLFPNFVSPILLLFIVVDIKHKYVKDVAEILGQLFVHLFC